VRRPYDPSYDDSDEDLMSDETDDEALEVELAGEALLDAGDARAAVAYEAGVWRDLRGAIRPRRRMRNKRTAGEAVDEHVRTRKRKRRKVVVRDALADALKSPDGVKVKSAAMIEDSE
jgi:hypothetical protein